MHLSLRVSLHRQFPQPDAESCQNKAQTENCYARSNPRQKGPFIGEIFSSPLRFIYRRALFLIWHPQMFEKMQSAATDDGN